MEAPRIVHYCDGRVDLLTLHQHAPRRYPCFLESAAHDIANGRFDILFAFPSAKLELSADGKLKTEGVKTRSAEFLKELDRWQSRLRIPQVSYPRVPFFGGWFIYFGYEFASQIEPTIPLPSHDEHTPLALALRIPSAVVYDNQADETILVTEPDSGHLVEPMREDLAKMVARPSRIEQGEGVLEEDPPQAYLNGIERIKRYIKEGDVFQVNLSRAWRGRLAAGIGAADLYSRLRATNPAPFAGLASFGDWAIVSSSPERLVRARSGFVETRPIAGTHPRDKDRHTDEALSAALLSHPKERAEHIMLIDLERNDLGRISEIGSVEVNELMVLESYTHVHHIVSNVRGRLKSDMLVGDIIAAVFPGGTITGCPKVRCMEIIAELEEVRRGPYTGSMGYLNRDGSADTNILIRTFCVTDDRVVLRAGGGIVADSVSERELAESRHKARGPVRAVQGLLA